eukprot:9664300-Karenia_brevis.AAC.1
MKKGCWVYEGREGKHYFEEFSGTRVKETVKEAAGAGALLEQELKTKSSAIKAAWNASRKHRDERAVKQSEPKINAAEILAMLGSQQVIGGSAASGQDEDAGS